jgi:hypothetical protein
MKSFLFKKIQQNIIKIIGVQSWYHWKALNERTEFLVNNFIIFRPNVQDIEISIIFVIGNSIQIQKIIIINK